MSHAPTDQCLGCRLAARLQETDQLRINMLHRLVANMYEMTRLCYEADQVDFDVTSELIESAAEDIIAEYLGNQLPGTSTHH